MRKLLYIFLGIIPIAYTVNFVYAIKTGATGGTFGDTFGAANALFSGAALFMLIYAVILQREELSIVKDERNDTKELLRGQEEITRLQRSALEQQIFEQSFNSLLGQALDERARLSLQIQPSEQNSPTHFGSSKRACKKLLRYLSEGTDITTPNLYNSNIRALSQQFFINLIVRLTTMIEQAPTEKDNKAALRQVITSLLGPDVCIAIIFFHAQSLIHFQDMHNVKNFIEAYGIENYLDDDAKEQYTKILASKNWQRA